MAMRENIPQKATNHEHEHEPYGSRSRITHRGETAGGMRMTGGESMARRKTVTFPANVKKIGNGYFIAIQKDYMEKLDLSEGDDVDVSVSIPEVIE